MLKQIVKELNRHAPFTIFGAFTGIIIMVISYDLSFEVSHQIFYILHPIHVLLSALVTASMYKIHHRNRIKLYGILLVGYLGSVGIATLSDSVIPYLGEVLLGLPNRGIHLGFIEEWWIINPAALIGIAIAYFRPTTKFPHAGHVLLSTAASLFHIIMAFSGLVGLNWILISVVFLFLFLAVWLPCCISDIIFPLLFVRTTDEKNRGGMHACL